MFIWFCLSFFNGFFFLIFFNFSPMFRKFSELYTPWINTKNFLSFGVTLHMHLWCPTVCSGKKRRKKKQRQRQKNKKEWAFERKYQVWFEWRWQDIMANSPSALNIAGFTVTSWTNHRWKQLPQTVKCFSINMQEDLFFAGIWWLTRITTCSCLTSKTSWFVFTD